MKNSDMTPEQLREEFGLPLVRDHPVVMDGKCSTPGCQCSDNTLVMTSACHPGRGVDVLVDKRNGIVYVRCHVCNTAIFSLQMAAAADLALPNLSLGEIEALVGRAEKEEPLTDPEHYALIDYLYSGEFEEEEAADG